MKKHAIFALLSILVVAIFASCATMKKSSSEMGEKTKLNVKPTKRPDIIDHKNMKWGKEPPEWVSMETGDIEKAGTYGDVYVFKFESEKGKDLEGSQIWIKNFSVGSEISRLISQRVQDKAVSAAEGNKDQIASFTKELVKIVSQATINGLKKESDYWVLQRHYNADGDPEGDFYLALVLYSIPKGTLDGIVKEAIKQANAKEPATTPEEKDVRDTVMKAFDAGM